MALSRAMRNAAGQWKRFSLTDTTGQPVAIYINSDKSAKQIRTEVHTNKLLQLMQQRYPRQRWRAFRTKGKIHCDSMPVVKILMRGQADPSIPRWNEQVSDNPQYQELDRGNIRTSFQAFFADTETATWRS